MKGFLAVLGAVALVVSGCSGSSSNSLSNTTASASSRGLLDLTTTTATSNTTYVMAPAHSNQIGSSECNDNDPSDGGSTCTQYTRTCSEVTENTSSCQSAREALGLSGNWLLFSCNVVEGLATSTGTLPNLTYASTTSYSAATYVSLTTQDFPTYKTNWYPDTGSYDFTANGSTVTGLFSALYTSYTTAFPDPGSIAAPSETITMYIPKTPSPCTSGGCSTSSSSENAMAMGAVGMAVNGVYIYSSMAAGTDNIFAEDGSFDQCDAHPAGSQYHYHSEPYSISFNDDNLIGVMMDGYWVYGREDSDGTTPGTVANEESGGSGSDDTSTANTIYFFGGHSGALPNQNSTTQFHYHLTEWIGCYDSTLGSGSYYYGDNGVTYDTFNASAFSGTGPAAPATTTPYGGNEYCRGLWVDAWFLTGHGNGGVFQTPSNIGDGGTPASGAPVWTSVTSPSGPVSTYSPSTCGGSSGTGTGGACFSQTTAGVRYYYGVPGTCPNCNSNNTIQ